MLCPLRHSPASQAQQVQHRNINKNASAAAGPRPTKEEGRKEGRKEGSEECTERENYWSEGARARRSHGKNDTSREREREREMQYLALEMLH